MSKWFTPAEVDGLQPSFVEMLDKAREFADVPFVITSGFRSASQNASIGGAPNSAHTRGWAVDLRCSDSWVRYRIVRGLIFAGVPRIELAALHCHADADPSLHQNILWLGDDH